METLLITLPILIFSIVLHEVAHGYAARAQGDPTAAMLGRLTLNPIPHLDPFGSFLVPGLLALSGTGVVFGWARPVPVNPRNYREYRRGDIIVSLAGVAVNLVLAFVFALLQAAVVWIAVAVPGFAEPLGMLRQMFLYGVSINLILLLFNLVPIPPLDGSHVLYHLLPPALGARYREMGRYGMILVFGFLFLGGFNLLIPPLRAMSGFAIGLGNLLLGV
jgi:Zn-dependent protease